MDDREYAIVLVSLTLARQGWQGMQKNGNLMDSRLEDWDNLDAAFQAGQAIAYKDKAEEVVSILVPSVLRSMAEEWHWNNVDAALRGLAGYYETGEYEDE